MLDMVGIGADRRRPLRQYSKGMIQRVGIAQALVNEPELVILDEPMSGLDPVGRREVRELIMKLRDQGRTVLFSSHILSDAELLCTRVGILAKGRLVASGALTELTASGRRGNEVVASNVTDGLAASMAPAFRDDPHW
jgi:ABC-2 type transport system ATP-binding protein